MEEQEVITNDTNVEDVFTDSTNEISTNSETVSQVVNPDAVDFSTYRASVSRYFIDKELYTISLYLYGDVPLYTFAIPHEYASCVTVIDGMIYNFGKETIKLSSNFIKGYLDGNTTHYYVTLELPVYGSPEYYACLSESSAYSELNESPVPYNLYVTFDFEGKLITSEYSVDTGAYFKSDNSNMVSWSLETIFVFIILILMIGKTVFRKG